MKRLTVTCDKCGEKIGASSYDLKAYEVRIGDKVYDFCPDCYHTLLSNYSKWLSLQENTDGNYIVKDFI